MSSKAHCLPTLRLTLSVASDVLLSSRGVYMLLLYSLLAPFKMYFILRGGDCGPDIILGAPVQTTIILIFFLLY